MVRRLKRDLKKLGIESVPDRILVQIDLEHERGAVVSSSDALRIGKVSPTDDLGPGEAVDLELAEKCWLATPSFALRRKASAGWRSFAFSSAFSRAPRLSRRALRCTRAR